jgi:hypothetical protein
MAWCHATGSHEPALVHAEGRRDGCSTPTPLCLRAVHWLLGRPAGEHGRRALCRAPADAFRECISRHRTDLGGPARRAQLVERRGAVCVGHGVEEVHDAPGGGDGGGRDGEACWAAGAREGPWLGQSLWPGGVAALAGLSWGDSCSCAAGLGLASLATGPWLKGTRRGQVVTGHRQAAHESTTRSVRRRSRARAPAACLPAART